MEFNLPACYFYSLTRFSSRLYNIRHYYILVLSLMQTIKNEGIERQVLLILKYKGF